jgi:hypothetical protein
MRRFLWTWAVLLCVTAAAAGQTFDVARLQRRTQEIGVWGGYSPDSMEGIGKSLHRKFFELNGQYAITMWTGREVAVKWVSEIVPLALLNEPNEYYFNTKHVQTGFRAGATTYAGGVTPLGMQVNFRNGHRVQPFFDAHGGMLYFMRQEPVPQSSQFNFTFNFGTGVQWFTGRRSSVLIGYKYHHISNNETAAMNPGIDSSEGYVGYLWRWR